MSFGLGLGGLANQLGQAAVDPLERQRNQLMGGLSPGSDPLLDLYRATEASRVRYEEAKHEALAKAKIEKPKSYREELQAEIDEWLR